MAFLRYANRFGFPCIESTSVTSDGTNTTVAFNPHQGGDNFFGGFWVKIGQNVATSTEPLQFTTTGVVGSTVPVYLQTGVQATVANIVTTGGGIFLLFYDRDNNRVTLIG